MKHNPVIANMFTLLDCMEKRPNFLPDKVPQYQTETISFHITFYNLKILFSYYTKPF